MKDYEVILRMIENVDPEDTGTLDEIDIKVFRYCGVGCYPAIPIHVDKSWPKYTRSRDVLKSVRPEGWFVSCRHIDKWNTELICSAYKLKNKTHLYEKVSSKLPTEELTELHAIIQAIAHEREVNERTR